MEKVPPTHAEKKWEIFVATRVKNWYDIPNSTMLDFRRRYCYGTMDIHS